MKKTFFFSISLFAIALFTWQCAKDSATNTDTVAPNLKSALNSSVARLNNAVNLIKSTTGYQILKIQDDSYLKSASANLSLTCEEADSIDLSDIKGIYEYQPTKFNNWRYDYYDKLFKKTGESDYLIVRMPKIKIFSPRRFRNPRLEDSVLTNNFEIKATNFHSYYSKPYVYDYKLTTSCSLDSTLIGGLDIHSSCNYPSACKYSALFSFANGYGINVYSSKGDTSISSFGLSDSAGVIFKEVVKSIKVDGKKHREKEYALTIGNIEIKRIPAQDSIEIYVSGVLQTNAKVEFIDNDTIEEKSICNKRDIQITFDDGTTAKLSELAGPAITTLSSLVGSMQSVYFASNIVNYIAFNIRANCIYKK
jgi:hypothetical protein